MTAPVDRDEFGKCRRLVADATPEFHVFGSATRTTPLCKGGNGKAEKVSGLFGVQKGLVFHWDSPADTDTQEIVRPCPTPAGKQLRKERNNCAGEGALVVLSSVGASMEISVGDEAVTLLYCATTNRRLLFRGYVPACPS